MFLVRPLATLTRSPCARDRRRWMVLLVGGAAAGKTAVARQLAALVDAPLTELALTAATDTGDLLGSFEQVEAAP